MFAKPYEFIYLPYLRRAANNLKQKRLFNKQRGAGRKMWKKLEHTIRPGTVSNRGGVSDHRISKMSVEEH